jgi:hypothetical protein
MSGGPDGLDLSSVAAVVFDWDGTAVKDRQVNAAPLRRRVEALLQAGVHVAIVSGTNLANIDGQLQARRRGDGHDFASGRLWLCLNRGSEVYEIGPHEPELCWRRLGTAAEEGALDDVATRVTEALARKGLRCSVVTDRLNRRKIDLIPEPAWAAPSKELIGELLETVQQRLHDAGIADGLAEVVALTERAAREAGLAGPGITTDAKHVEVGLTDKGDSARWVLSTLAAMGIGPGLVLVVGDEFGPLGGVAGSDARLLVAEAARSRFVSVGPEPEGVPDGVEHRPGGPPELIRLVDRVLAGRSAGRVPGIDHDPA